MDTPSDNEQAIKPLGNMKWILLWLDMFAWLDEAGLQEKIYDLSPEVLDEAINDCLMNGYIEIIDANETPLRYRHTANGHTRLSLARQAWNATHT
jgi:hypothetical protein